MNTWNSESCDHSPAAVSVAFAGYDSLIDLRRQLLEADISETSTVVLALDDWFSGSLSSLLAREVAGGRLVVTSVSGNAGHVPELVDLCADPQSSGWTSITFERQPVSALHAALASETEGGVIVFWPAWNRVHAARQLLAGISTLACQPA